MTQTVTDDTVCILGAICTKKRCRNPSPGTGGRIGRGQGGEPALRSGPVHAGEVVTRWGEGALAQVAGGVVESVQVVRGLPDGGELGMTVRLGLGSGCERVVQRGQHRVVGGDGAG